jgi:hypothetical protein
LDPVQFSVSLKVAVVRALAAAAVVFFSLQFGLTLKVYSAGFLVEVVEVAVEVVDGAAVEVVEVVVEVVDWAAAEVVGVVVEVVDWAVVEVAEVIEGVEVEGVEVVAVEVA